MERVVTCDSIKSTSSNNTDSVSQEPGTTNGNDNEISVSGLSSSNSSPPFHSFVHAENLLAKMQNYFYCEQLTDVVITCGPMKVSAHRLVLAAASPYFTAMFTGNLKESTTSIVEFKDVNPEALLSMVRYCYSGALELSEETVESQLAVACILQLEEAAEACCNFLSKHLHPSNCLGIRLFAEHHGRRELARIARDYTIQHFSLVVQHQEFTQLSAEEVANLLSAEDLNIVNEEAALDALMSWVSHDATHRYTQLPNLLGLVRLPLLNASTLADLLEQHPKLGEDRKCQSLVVEALRFHLVPGKRDILDGTRTRPRRSTVGSLFVVDSSLVQRYDPRLNRWSTTTITPTKRHQFGLAYLGGLIIIVGGRTGLKTLNIVEYFDISDMKNSNETWSFLPAMHTHRHGLCVAALTSDGPLYAVGGHDGWSFLNSVERWDPESRKWNFAANMISPRSTAGLAALHGKLYTVGGRDGTSCLSTVERYDPPTDRWIQCPLMTRRRAGVGVAALNGCIYAAGGHDAPFTNPTNLTGGRFDCVERLDPRTDAWAPVAPLSVPRDTVALCNLGDQLIAVGGFDGQRCYNLVEAYDPRTDVWTPLASLPNAKSCVCVCPVPLVP